MLRELTFIVPGTPTAKQRPRLCSRNGFTRAYTPAKTKRYENMVALAAQAAMNGTPMLTGPLFLHARCFWPCPVSKHRKREPCPVEWRAKGADADNVAKAILDGCNGVIYKDDSCVVQLFVEKYQQAQGADAEVIVCVKQLTGVQNEYITSNSKEN